MGLANLVLAQHALADELAEDPDLHARVLIARGRATAALRRHALWVIGTPASTDRRHAQSYPYYSLYALEKVCVFLDREEIGGLDWYREGVHRLLASQLQGGGWSNGSRTPGTVPTSFALLFLLRDAESYRPITPRPIQSPKGPTTPGPAPATSSPRAPRPTLPLAVADAGLARLEAALARHRIDKVAPVLEALAFVRRTYETYRPDGEPLSPDHDAWCRRAEDVLLDAAVLYDGSKKADRDQRMAIALEALDILAGTSLRIGPRLMGQVLERENDKTFPTPFRLAWYGAALDALRAVKPLQLAAWLSRRCVSDDRGRLWRTVAALTALSGLAPELPGAERRAAAQGLIRSLASATRRSDGDFRWNHLFVDAAVCLHRLARGADAEDLPDLPGDRPKAELEVMSRWIRAHAATDDPAWR